MCRDGPELVVVHGAEAAPEAHQRAVAALERHHRDPRDAVELEQRPVG
jgi:hypothetical protein